MGLSAPPPNFSTPLLDLLFSSTAKVKNLTAYIGDKGFKGKNYTQFWGKSTGNRPKLFFSSLFVFFYVNELIVEIEVTMNLEKLKIIFNSALF